MWRALTLYPKLPRGITTSSALLETTRSIHTAALGVSFSLAHRIDCNKTFQSLACVTTQSCTVLLHRCTALQTQRHPSVAPQSSGSIAIHLAHAMHALYCTAERGVLGGAGVFFGIGVLVCFLAPIFYCCISRAGKPTKTRQNKQTAASINHCY